MVSTTSSAMVWALVTSQLLRQHLSVSVRQMVAVIHSKMCIRDSALLDQFLAYDDHAHCAIETFCTTGQVVIMGDVYKRQYFW